MYNAVTFGTFTMLGHHHCVVLEHSYHPRKKPGTHSREPPTCVSLWTCPLCTFRGSGTSRNGALRAGPVLGRPGVSRFVRVATCQSSGSHHCLSCWGGPRLGGLGSVIWKVAWPDAPSGLCDPESCFLSTFVVTSGARPCVPRGRGWGAHHPQRPLWKSVSSRSWGDGLVTQRGGPAERGEPPPLSP